MRIRALLLSVMVPISLQAQTRPRAQDLGIVFGGTPGPHNAITDVAGVEVGHTTLISGEGSWSTHHSTKLRGVETPV